MNEEIRFANKVRQALNEDARLDGARGAVIAERLRAARERALAAAAPERAPAFGWARLGADGVIGGFGGFALRVLLPTLLLIAGLGSIYSWQQEQRAADVEEIDAQLLTDVLPIDAYLDRGFEAWLKKVSADH
ncbi:MAG: DUF3619 family protein [Burkholderiales bacterium]|nr:DUF3619 family protein [Burkholderiales bacterium]